MVIADLLEEFGYETAIVNFKQLVDNLGFPSWLSTHTIRIEGLWLSRT
jgi:hypothetical protein